MLVVLPMLTAGVLLTDRVIGAEPRSAISPVSALQSVRVVKTRPVVPGYDRECGPGRGCVFGPSWTEDHAGIDGHDGCDTRNNVLRRELDDIVFRPGTRDCVVIAGTLDDPYTGRTLRFTKQHAGDVQIDHPFPLALA